MRKRRPGGPGRGVDRKGRSRRDPRHVRLYHWMLDSEAWRSLSLAARCLLIEVWKRHNGFNNGEIPFSVREAAKNLGVSKDTAQAAFRELRDRGFLKLRQAGSFHYKTRHASEWEITAEPPKEGEPATKDFMRWPPDKAEK